MIVARENEIPLKLMAEFRAIPVRMPGRAIGRIRTKESVCRPKKRNRWTAKAAAEPSRRAIVVAPRAAWIDSHRAERSSLFRHATLNHLVVKPEGGHDWM